VIKGIQVDRPVDVWNIDNELKFDADFDQQEDMDMKDTEVPTILGTEQRKLYQELNELADLVPEINDLQYTLKH
jgi:hypothetical protein